MHANRITVTVLVAALLGVGWSGTESAPAQETKPAERAKLTADSRDPASELTLEEVEAALAAIESDSSLDDTAKSALRPNYEQAVAAFRARRGIRVEGHSVCRSRRFGSEADGRHPRRAAGLGAG